MTWISLLEQDEQMSNEDLHNLLQFTSSVVQW
jgi:hypothetical protein